MNDILKNFLIDQYYGCGIITADDILQTRIEAIDHFTNIFVKENINPLLKYYLDVEKEPSIYIPDIVDYFQKKEPTFTLKNKCVDLKLFSGLLILQCLFEKELNKNIRLLLACTMQCMRLRKSNNILLYDRLMEETNSFIEQLSITERSYDEINIRLKMPKLELQPITENNMAIADKNFEGIKSVLNKIVDNQFSIMNGLEKKMHAQLEETNILWWLIANNCSTLNKTYDKLKKEEAVLIVAKELNDLTKILPGPQSIEVFIDMVLAKSKGKENNIKLSTIFTSINIDIRKQFCEQFKTDEIQNDTPIMLGLCETLQSENSDAWETYYRNKTGINAQDVFDIFFIAKQFYKELVLLRIKQELTNE